MTGSDHSAQQFLEGLREDRLDSYRYTPQDIQAHFSDEGQIQSDYHKRFAFELIQNADDAMQGIGGEKKVRFEVHDGVLLVANTGRPIDRKDVTALCTMSHTTKGADGEKRASIGHKGRGFSSVLEITDRPQVYSTGISFEFDGDRSQEEISSILEEVEGWSMDRIDGVPLMRLPFSPQKTPDRVQKLLDKEYNTVFRFPLKDKRVLEDVIETVRSVDRNTVLFLQELEQLTVDVEGQKEEIWDINREQKSWSSDSTTVTFVSVRQHGAEAESDEKTFALFSRDEVEIKGHTGGIDENTWGDVKYTRIGLALRVREESDGVHLTRLEEKPFVHVFLPTEEQCPIPVLVNGAFHTAISRTNINVTRDEDNYNGFLLQQVAHLLATDVREYAEQTATTVEEFIDCLDFTDVPVDSRDVDRLEGRFIEALQDEFAAVSFIPRLEKLASEKELDNPGVKSISEIVVPYYSNKKPKIAEAVARIYGNDKLDLSSIEATGWFPKTTLLNPRRAAILEGLGASVLDPEDVPAVLGSAPDESSPLMNYPDQGEELAVDPILQVLIWIWKTVSGQDEVVDRFIEAAQDSDVFPVGTPDGRIVRHVAKTDGTKFFIPPRRELPDIELPGIRFLTLPVYRPEASVETQKQSELVEELKPGLEAIWDVSEFDFEEVVRAAVFPKVQSPQNDEWDDSELRDEQILDLIRRLGSQSIKPDQPLPFVERDGTLHRLCLLPVPTRDGGWAPAYRVYFGKEWQPELPEAAQIESLLQEANVDQASYLARPEELPGDVSGDKDHEGDTDENSVFDSWKRFFRWLGVSQHVKLEPLFDPTEERQMTAMNGMQRPEDASILIRLEEVDWQAYRQHLLEALESSGKERREYDSVYQLQGVEYFNQFLEEANQDRAVAELLFRHLVYWWQEDLRDYENPVLATSDQRTWTRRNQNSPTEVEERRVGLNLWIWQLMRASWCPSNRGRFKPEEVWMPTETVRKRFSIHETMLLPVLSEEVREAASEVPDLLAKLGIRHEVSRESIKPDDAVIITETVSDMFADREDEFIADSLRQIKPVYRYLSELLPGLDQSRTITDGVWQEAQVRLQQIPVLSRDGSGFAFELAGKTYFVRSPDVLDRIPVEGVPIFVLQEDESVRFGTYFGLLDLEEEADPEPEFLGEDKEETDEVIDFLEQMAPFILCRLEAERPSQDLIDDDINGMAAFLENLMLVEEIDVKYQFDAGDEETVIESKPDFFLDRRGRDQNERPLPFVKKVPAEEDQHRILARALCEYLGVSQLEGVMTLLNAETDQQRRQYLRLAGAPSTPDEIEGKRQELFGEDEKGEKEFEYKFDDERKAEGFEEEDSRESLDPEGEIERGKQQETRDHPVYDSSELSMQGDSITITTEPEEGDKGTSKNEGSSPGRSTGTATSVTPDYRTRLDKLGMSITLQSEWKRLEEEYDCENPQEFVFDIHNENEIEEAKKDEVAGPVLEWLEKQGLPMPFPGFDILTVNPETGKADRLIELKSSGHDTRTPPVTWNEWKTASNKEVRDIYYLYIVGNLRKDVKSDPYLREIPNPFDLLNARTQERREVKKEVKVNVKSFEERTENEVREVKISVDDE